MFSPPAPAAQSDDSGSGSVIVNNRIEVSSNEAGGTPRRSNAGGLIHIESAKTTGTAIQITSTAQLLSLLNSAATGAGGVIEVKATGNNSAVSVQGTLTADNGTVDIEQTGTNGQIFLNNATIGGSRGSDAARHHQGGCPRHEWAIVRH